MREQNTTDLERLLPELVVTPNEEIHIGEYEAALSAAGREFACTVSASLRLLPNPMVRFNGALPTDDHPLAMIGLALQADRPTLSFPDMPNPVDVSLSNMSSGVTTAFSASLLRDMVWVGQRSDVMAVQFHLMNIPDFLTQEASATYDNSVVLTDTDYDILIVPASNKQETFDRLKAVGGYGCAHVGVLAKRSRSAISPKEAEDALTCLHYFLSFARGGWAGVTLPAGVGADGRPIWRQLGARVVDPWASRISWADRHNFQALIEAYDGFAALWKDEFWHEIIRKAIYWYQRSNDTASGLDGGIILTQAALESLAWSYLVEHAHVIDRHQFGQLKPSQRLSQLLQHLDIPIEVPSGLPALQSLASDWDGPRVFSEVRNDLVHPIRRSEWLHHERMPFFEVWTLGQWYLELSLLRLMKFTGTYRDRTRHHRWVGEVSPVPWMKSGVDNNTDNARAS